MSMNELNVKIVRAVGKQPLLYDRNDDNYRKRLPTENCWDLVAAETGESVERCKRRWRQIRNDYARYLTNEGHRRQNAKKSHPYSADIKFLLPHMDCKEDGLDEYDDTKSEGTVHNESDRMNSSDRSSVGSTVGTPGGGGGGGGSGIKQGSKKMVKSVDGEKLSKKGVLIDPVHEAKIAKDKHNNNNKKVSEELASDDEEIDQLRSENSPSIVTDNSPAQSTSKSPQSEEFFIKQSGASDNLLIISKKPSSTSMAASTTTPVGVKSIATQSGGGGGAGGTPTDRLEDTTMTEESADESVTRVARRGRPRRTGIKELPIKKTVVEQRLTRLQRRKSLYSGAEHSLRSSTSPVKMTPVPRNIVNQGKTQGGGGGGGSVKEPPKTIAEQTEIIAAKTTTTTITTTTNNNNNNNNTTNNTNNNSNNNNKKEDIYPRNKTFSGSQVNQQQQQQQHQQPQPQQQQQQQLITSSSESTISIQRRDIVAMKQIPSLTPFQKSNTFATIQQKRTPPTSSQIYSQSTTGKVANVSTTATTTTTVGDSLTNQAIRLPHNNSVVISTTPSQSSSSSGVGGGFVVQTAPPLLTTCGSVNSSGATTTTTTMPTPMLTYVKRCERGTQTQCPDVYSDQYFLDMVQPQMQQMNARQKFRFKQKVFKSLMETFDDATDFPANGEVQHFNINTPSGLEDITDPELRLVRELVTIVCAAKRSEVTMNSSNGRNGDPVGSEQILRTGQRVTDSNLQRHIIQQVQKQVNAATSPGPDKKVYRILPMNGGRKDQAMPVSRVIAGTFAGNSKGSSTSIVAARSPQDSSLNALFGPLKASTISTASQQRTSTAAGVTSLQIRQMSRRFSVCGAGGSTSGIPGTLTPPQQNHNIKNNAELLKRRLVGGPSDNLVPAQQRPRLSTVSNDVVSPNTSLLRKSNTNPNTIAVGQKQTSPSTGLAPIQHRTPQIASVQGSAAPFDFVQPNAVKSSPQAAGRFRRSQSPIKRPSLVVANVKSVGVKQQGGGGGVAVGGGGGGGVGGGGGGAGAGVAVVVGGGAAIGGGVAGSSGPQSVVKTKPPLIAPPVVNMTNLLGNSTSSSKSPPQNPNRNQNGGDTETAATIAADDFSLAGLKREPRDPLDDHDDILGI